MLRTVYLHMIASLQERNLIEGWGIDYLPHHQQTDDPT